MRCLYNIIFYLALPFIFLRLLLKARKNPDYKHRWRERLGFVNTKNKLTNSIWIHAVSLGEAIAATPLIKAIQKQFPDSPIVVTTMTPTGSAHINKTFGDTLTHSYIPYDYSGAIKRFLQKTNPKLLVIMETELWPNLLHYCAKQKVKIIIANARISAHSENGYKKIRWFMRKLFRNINVIATQSQIDTTRFINIGANSKQVQTVGNIKFDIHIPADIPIKAKNLRQQWGKMRPVWIAASTHNNEEEQILKAFKTIKLTLPELLLILVPRHPERFGSVTNLAKSQEFKVASYKAKEPCTDTTDIVIGDVIGELLLLYAASDVAFVGGSLVPIGGHNLLEPAALNIPIITGDNLNNFIDISKLLEQNQGLIKVKDTTELTHAVIALFQNSTLRKQQSENALKVVKQNQGTVEKLLAFCNSDTAS